MSASIPYWASRSWFVPGLIIVFAIACGSSESGSEPGGSPEPPGLSVNNLVCQLDPPTFTATVVGGIDNTLMVDAVAITPVVRWLDGDGAVVFSKTGVPIDFISAGDTELFSISAILIDEMASCQIELSGLPVASVTGELQAEAILTSELAK